ncbi:hypothetical protein PR202_gb23573 [Eleusine coracana subsp. coracana]|uniref:3'-5' exonuclease domain-containing protein n=1 Tax=Eleusine coracana subsp. coracana TaxID=191504 RepID=A0AAV5FIK8_ELECO|nr:hypothetical protein PR202_gb23573 [Eleusine coracana subsp. coracana]
MLSRREYAVTTFRFGAATVIEATVTRDAAVANAWVRCLRDSHHHHHHHHHVPSSSPSTASGSTTTTTARPPSSTRALLYARRVPECLHRLLLDPAVRLVGVGDEAAARLAADHGIACAAAVDLEGPCRDYLRRGKGEGEGQGQDGPLLGLKGCAEKVLGLTMKRPANIVDSDWEKRELDVAQVRFACFDAYVAYRIGEQVLGRE